MGLLEQTSPLADAQRQIAGLQKADQIIELLTALLAEQQRTNELLERQGS
ncbi:MAG: hypothetical protein ACXVXP_06980 [Mycobacteriaceae bacterium]